MRLPSKKLITLLSSIALVGILIHLIGVYLYAGWRFEWVKWGSIRIGIVDTPPSPMNPFQYGNDTSADFVYRLLFRGLIRYDIQKQVYTGDIGNCDISDASLIKCTLRDDAIWSDGTKIQIDDVIASIDTFRKSSPSEKMRVFLDGVTAKKVNDMIEIRSKTKNPLMIDLLTYPIVRTDVIDLIRTGRIGQATYITSGPYTFTEITNDKAYGFDRIVLSRNEKWPSGDVWLDKIQFMFFSSLANLTSSIETLTVVVPPAKTEKLDLWPRFDEFLYSNYEYFSLFFNTAKLGKDLRNTLHWQLGNMLATMDKTDENIRVQTFFSTGSDFLPEETIGKNWSDVMRQMGYQKKMDTIALLEKSWSLVSGEATFSPTKYWYSGGSPSTLFILDASGEILLSGKTPEAAKSVSINDYTLREFEPGSSKFVYRVRSASGTLQEWKNTYTLRIDTGTASGVTEDLTIYWSADSAKLDGYKKEVQEAYNALQNTPAMVADRERKKAEEIEKIRALSNEYYYNVKYEPFSLKVAYAVWPQSTELYGKKTEEALRLLGIKTELIPYTPKDLQAIITSGEKNYDILITGIAVNGSIANIGQFFASGNNGSKVNFSNYTNTNLDSLFAKLKSTTDDKAIQEIESAIAKIFKKESFFFPISSPVHRIFIDRNIRGVPPVELIPDIPSFADVFMKTSIKEHYILNLQWKSIWGFFSWIASQF